MPTRTVRTAEEREAVCTLIRGYDKPIVVQITPGAGRSIEQNRLQFLWVREVAEQLQDESAEDKRAYCKLHFGVPILRLQNESFRDQYDRLIRPLNYEAKMELMKAPIDFPVTSLMTVAQGTEYLHAVWDHFTHLGVKLTDPTEGTW